ncbi:hypothetical protein E2562_025756 [Oryza meyeriana var. granulata]|uniref:Uncharacterized protein n=1 Tax=Oryza meyeriana var. granulata TaxID=110450 RepID=A0A6G1CRD7_9ORYZ|nr:hypothetical protein E2562_025756 [Oryza meyeriana var. granulata]
MASQPSSPCGPTERHKGQGRAPARFSREGMRSGGGARLPPASRGAVVSDAPESCGGGRLPVVLYLATKRWMDSFLVTPGSDFASLMIVHGLPLLHHRYHRSSTCIN